MNAQESNEPEIGKTRRKYLAEAGLNLFSGGATVLRPSDLYRYKDDQSFRDAIDGCNIYVIARRRKIIVCPESIKVSNGLLYGDFLVYLEQPFSFERFPFSQKQFIVDPTGNEMHLVDAQSDPYGQNVKAIDNSGKTVSFSSHSLIPISQHSLGSETKLEVLYIGQAYGKDGGRLAIDRLSTHSTLQRILAETAEHRPNDEILLLMFRFEHSKNIISSAGDFSVEPIASETEEHNHFIKVGGAKFDRKERILLAEAALINYFKPKYNIMHRDSFGKMAPQKLKTLKALLANDFTALIVELNTSNLGSQLYTDAAPALTLNKIFSPDVLNRLNSLEGNKASNISGGDGQEFLTEMRHVHIARFALYSKEERETFIQSLPWIN